jgi:hypothetical protein
MHGDMDTFADYCSRLISEGYRPHSPWFETQCRQMNFNRRNIAQETECVGGETKITIRDKETGIEEIISIGELYKKLA